MKFIDLFAGLGGFHVGLKKAGHECVFACEIDEELAKLYEENFALPVQRDIRKINLNEVPKYDILCAGFPCQPFSKAGKQKGLNDLQNGDYLNGVIKFLEHHKPKFFILENVPNLRKHDRERTWKRIHKKLSNVGYNIKDVILSPHEFGIPQIRKRLFIVGSREDLNSFQFPIPKKTKTNVSSVLDKNPKKKDKLNASQLDCLNTWQQILNQIPGKNKFPSFPIWAMEFEATYPFENESPYYQSSKALGKYRGALGQSLNNLNKEEQLQRLPSYARINQKEFPEWKKRFIRQNREFYNKYKDRLKPFLKKLKQFSPSWQKFEWNCLNDKRIIKNYIIQFRASGVRVKKTDFFPALVLTTTQRPIIGWENRYITSKEAAKLQSLSSISLPSSEHSALKALGNAVNAKIIELIGKNLLE